MVLNSPGRHKETVGYLDVGHTFVEELEDLGLSCGEPCCVTSGVLAPAPRNRNTVFSQGLAKLASNGCRTQRFEGFQCLYARAVIAMHQGQGSVIGKTLRLPYDGCLERLALDNQPIRFCDTFGCVGELTKLPQPECKGSGRPLEALVEGTFHCLSEIWNGNLSVSGDPTVFRRGYSGLS